MSEEKSSYKQIMKATSLFGGVQVFTIAISIVRSKIVAILLGTAGIGLIGLYQTTISLISSITGMGLSSSAVRNISEANATHDEHKIALVIKTLRRWVWMTGMVGAVVTLSLASLLSKWTFGNENYTWSFVWLSIICLLSAISSGQNVLLQGMRRLRQMAKSTLFGSIIGLFTSIPLYYYFGVNGIVPSLIISTISALSISYYFARQIPIQKVEQSWNETYNAGLGMAKLGFVMMLSSFMVTLVSYAVNLFISHKGGVSDVGLYRAGWTIADQYTAIIFTAMATDYYPRLAAINSDNKKLGEAVNQQAEIALLILGPMLVALIGFAPLVVYILYTTKFLPVIGMIKWNLVGMLFKAASWALAFTVIAKGDNRLYFITETIANAIVLLLNIVGYSIWGLNGIGIAFAVSYLLYFMLISFVVMKRYGIYYNSVFFKIFIIQSLLVGSVFMISWMHSQIIVYAFVSLVFIIACLYSFVEMNKRMNIISIVRKFKK